MEHTQKVEVAASAVSKAVAMALDEVAAASAALSAWAVEATAASDVATASVRSPYFAPPKK